jgi:hypothetical protein
MCSQRTRLHNHTIQKHSNRSFRKRDLVHYNHILAFNIATLHITQHTIYIYRIVHYRIMHTERAYIPIDRDIQWF